MLSKVHPVNPKIGQLICIIGIGFLLSVLLVVFLTNAASAASYDSDSDDRFPALALQGTATPTPTLEIGPTSAYSFSLATLGFGDTTLDSPFGSTQYFFRIPGSWSIEGDGMLTLDLSYIYDQVNSEGYPSLFGDLTVTLNNQVLETFFIEEELDHYQLRVLLPSSLLANPERTQHIIGLSLDAGLLCEVPHRGTLTIHPTSSISLTYSQHSLVPDLSSYPWPFFQRAFEPDSVRFVLPSQPTTNDLANALAVAGKLGDLTNNRLVISATTDSYFLESASLQESPITTPLDEHLIVIGRPQDNQLLSLLNEVADLPVSLHQRQLELATQGPALVAPDDVFAYTFVITNTIDRDINLTLVDSPPFYTELVDCTPDCAENSEDNTVTWSDNLLAPAETLRLSLTLRATDTLTDTTLDNTITLFEADLGPINADTLTSAVVNDSADGELQVSVAGEEGYFFVYDGRAVAREDGIVQEVPSPWSQSRAILIMTGLSDEAVRKASQAMSSEARFPGMDGPVAMVREALSSSEINDLPPIAVEATFEDLGYDDQVIRGRLVQQVSYDFDVPMNWQLTDDSFIDIYFRHSQIIDYSDSGLTVFVNDRPFATIPLNDETSGGGHIRIDLADAATRSGQTNRLSLQGTVSLVDKCAENQFEQAWILIQNNSRIFLAHDEVTGLNLDLEFFPSPFDANHALTDLLFALPEDPTVEEWEASLRLAAVLGRSAAGETIAPTAMVGDDLPLEAWTGYHIIALGRPSRNPLLQQANSYLPQPFVPGSDEIEQRLDDVVFRLSPDTDLGYVQLMPSPWDEARAFLAVTGTTDEGVQWATQTLGRRRTGLEGNLALIRDDLVNTIDTRPLTSMGVAAAVATAVATPVPEATSVTETPVAMATPTPSPSPSPTPGVPTSSQTSAKTGLPGWLIPLVGVNGLLVIAILAFAFWQMRRKRS